MSKLLKKSKSKKTPKAPKSPEPPQEPWHRVGRGEPVDTVDIPGIERLLAKRSAATAKKDYATADKIAMQLFGYSIFYLFLVFLGLVVDRFVAGWMSV